MCVYTLVCINADTQKWMSEDNFRFRPSLSILYEIGIVLFYGNSPFSTFHLCCRSVGGVPLLDGAWGFELGFSGLHIRYFYQLSHLPRPCLPWYFST